MRLQPRARVVTDASFARARDSFVWRIGRPLVSVQKEEHTGFEHTVGQCTFRGTEQQRATGSNALRCCRKPILLCQEIICLLLCPILPRLPPANPPRIECLLTQCNELPQNEFD